MRSTDPSRTTAAENVSGTARDANVAASYKGRILVLCPYPVGVAAAQRLKFEQYYEDWRAAGYDVAVSPFMDMGMWRVLHTPGHHATKVIGTVRGYLRRIRDLFRIGRYDIIFVHMWYTPFGGPGLERLVRRLARKLVFDVEDNVASGAETAASTNPNPMLRFLKGSAKPQYLIEVADHVITSSPFLNETCLARNRNKASTYISSSVDTDRFLPATTYSNDRLVTIGWTGTFSSKPYLELIEPVLRSLAARHAFRLKVIGNFDYSLDGVETEVVRWTAEREVEDLQQFDIGVYPLPIDDWVLGKSGLKAIQYMAFGLPTVATEVGTTPLLIRDGENGLLVKTPDEWLAA